MTIPGRPFAYDEEEGKKYTITLPLPKERMTYFFLGIGFTIASAILAASVDIVKPPETLFVIWRGIASFISAICALGFFIASGNNKK